MVCAGTLNLAPDGHSDHLHEHVGYGHAEGGHFVPKNVVTAASRRHRPGFESRRNKGNGTLVKVDIDGGTGPDSSGLLEIRLHGDAVRGGRLENHSHEINDGCTT